MLAEAQNLVKLATGVASLSCEVTGCTISLFDEHFHAGNKDTMELASSLRILLDGSKNARKTRNPDPTAFSGMAQVPFVHGRLRNCLTDAMNALGSDSGAPSREVARPAWVVANYMTAIDEALRAAHNLAMQRITKLGEHLGESPAAITELLGVGAFDRECFGPTLVVELLLCLQALAIRDAAMRPAQPAPEAAAPQEGDKPQRRGNKKGGKVRQRGVGQTLGKGAKQLYEEFSQGFELVREAAQIPEALARLRARVCPDLNSEESVRLLDLLFRATHETNVRRLPKLPKGTRDYLPAEMVVRERVINTITRTFKEHGAVCIDTPVFEMKDTLTAKYGEDSKLIYDLQDQGGDMLSLRFDLTVPFARYLAVHNFANLKRYHIAKVYRRDQPALSKGRYREFMQCDFDIAGEYAPMIPDAEILLIVTEVLSKLDLGTFVVKLNHRKLLDAIMEVCGVPPSKFRAICSAIDKLDKEPWSAVRQEMTERKHLDARVADRIALFLDFGQGLRPVELLDLLERDEAAVTQHATDAEFPQLLSNLRANSAAREAFASFRLLFGYLEAMQCIDRMKFDLCLARGLDYYTGLIYEAQLVEGSQLGTVAAGGRYDNLVGMFSGKKIPAVGVSFGMERLFTFVEIQQKERLAARAAADPEAAPPVMRHNETQVLVASIGKGMVPHRIGLCCELWNAGIPAEHLYSDNPRMPKQIEFALQSGIPILAILGETEMQNGVVKLKDLATREEREVPRAEFIEAVRGLLLNH
eukprot:gnl/Trimastix_PCT/1496.p1 GENE.gnl/Trimastix_PCT/1496~~gnl/Trimastix_PCT/1496.p1  ORF type:complete len:757 (+),score=318.09 gnl/Trimastix_PCT/1496:52-2322(+)